MPLRIALCGLAGSGKSTAADYLVSRHKFKRLSYAAPIKKMLRVLLIESGATLVESIEMTEGRLKELPSPYLCGNSARYAMQSLGTEWGRELIGSEIWRRILINKVRTYGSTPVVVDDLRFPNEAEALKAEGFVIVRIKRSENAISAPHSSEGQEFEVDLTIQNDGSLQELESALDSLQ